MANPTGPLGQLRDAFLDCHRKVRANRARAAEIDLLIDRIVFRLFELTPEEQRLILSRVGPGRPLPPRHRGKRGAQGRSIQPGRVVLITASERLKHAETYGLALPLISASRYMSGWCVDRSCASISARLASFLHLSSWL